MLTVHHLGVSRPSAETSLASMSRHPAAAVGAVRDQVVAQVKQPGAGEPDEGLAVEVRGSGADADDHVAVGGHGAGAAREVLRIERAEADHAARRRPAKPLEAERYRPDSDDDGAVGRDRVGGAARGPRYDPQCDETGRRAPAEGFLARRGMASTDDDRAVGCDRARRGGAVAEAAEIPRR